MNELRTYKQNPKVMLIDDNAGEKIIVKAALKRINRENLKLEVFQNPLLALDHINELLRTVDGKKELPDVIFLDLNMPEMNGSELLAILKNIEELRTIPIIIVTTSALEEDLIKCYKLHANSVMQKPMDFDDYVKMIEITVLYWLYNSFSIGVK